MKFSIVWGSIIATVLIIATFVYINTRNQDFEIFVNGNVITVEVESDSMFANEIVREISQRFDVRVVDHYGYAGYWYGRRRLLGGMYKYPRPSTSDAQFMSYDGRQVLYRVHILHDYIWWTVPGFVVYPEISFQGRRMHGVKVITDESDMQKIGDLIQLQDTQNPHYKYGNVIFWGRS